MDLQTFAEFGDIAGGIAVVVSLVYLALQVRQNTQSLRNENYARALDRIAAIQSQLGQDKEFSRLFAKGVLDPAELTPSERVQLTWNLYEAFGAFEFMFHASRSGALDDELWVRWSGTIAWWLSFPGVQSWWRNRPAPFSASFSEHVERTLRDNPSDRAATARWQAFVADAGAAATPAAPEA